MFRNFKEKVYHDTKLKQSIYKYVRVRVICAWTAALWNYVLQERQMVGRPSTSFLSRLWMFDNIPHMNHIHYGGSRFSTRSSLTLTRQISRPVSFFETPQLDWSPFLCETIYVFSSPQMHAHMFFDRCYKVSSPMRYTWNIMECWPGLFFQLWNLWSSEVAFFASGFQLDLIVYNPLEKAEHHLLCQIPRPNSSAVHQLQQTLKPTVPLWEGCATAAMRFIV